MARPRSFGDVLSKLPDARKSRDDWTASCPAPGHRTPAGHLTLKDSGGKALVTCQGGRHGYEDICQALGFDSLTYSPDGGSPKATPARRKTTVTRYQVCNVEGQVIAVHVRRDTPTGKTFSWERPGGEAGLGGLPVAELPLYGAERLPGLPDGAEVVVCEGERCADSLRDKGIVAVGTVTGAGGTPGMEALRPLVRLTPILWPDSDDVGCAHMSRIAVRLTELGARPRIVSWPEAPPGGDAADAVTLGVDIPALLASAPEWQPPPGEDLGGLLREAEAFIRRFVVCGLAELVALALWVTHTWAFDSAECTPYLQVRSAEKQSAKTLLLEVLALLVARPWFTARVSAAVLVRKTDRDTPTLLLDETDAAFKGDAEYTEALRGLLNAGYRRGGVASLCVKAGGDFELRDFSCFCPKALAGLGELPDTIADRSIRITLKRKASTEIVARFRRRDAEALAVPIRARLESWATLAVPRLAEARPGLPQELSDRQNDVWEPLLAIADLAGGDWPSRARQAAVEVAAETAREDNSIGVALLRDIRVIFEKARTDALFTADLVNALNETDESGWGGWHDGTGLTGRDLAHVLKRYGIGPKQLRIGDKGQKGYQMVLFQDAWLRYTTVQPKQAKQAKHYEQLTNETPSETTGCFDPFVSDKPQIQASFNCFAVSDKTPVDQGKAQTVPTPPRPTPAASKREASWGEV